MLKAISKTATSTPVKCGQPPGRTRAATDFNFDQVYRDLDGASEGDISREALLAVVQKVCEWLYPARCRQATMLQRAYALVWFLRPEWLGNPTQVELAKRLGISKQSMGKVVNQFRTEFGFYVGGMRHDEARAKFKQAASAGAERLADARREAFKRKAAGR